MSSKILNKRNKPNKKWTDDEIKIIINYLHNSDVFEVPTAQIFYKKLIEETGLDCSWDLIKWKVRHLKSTFTKANDLRKSNNDGLLDSDEGVSSVHAKILQICPHFHKLSEIFGENIVDEEMFVYDSGNFMEQDLTVEDFGKYLCKNKNSSDRRSLPPIASAKSNRLSIKSEHFDENLQGNDPLFSETHLEQTQEERKLMLKMKFDFEREKHEKEMVIAEKRIKMEEVKNQAEIELRNRELCLKEKELENSAKLAILSLEKEERVQMYELQLKYKQV